MIWLLVGLLLACTSDGKTVQVSTDRYTKVTISTTAEDTNCSVCVGEGSSKACGSQQNIDTNQKTQVDFTCSRPQDIFNIKINREIDCSKKCSCDPLADWTTFKEFNRTFSWDMRLSSIAKSFQLEFPASGLRQIQSLEECPEKHTLSVFMYLRTPVNLGRFCQNGTITRIQILWRGRMTLEVPQESNLSSFSFIYSEATGSVLTVDAILPRGKSNTDFFSATGIPSDHTVMWNFVLPPKHNFTVQVLKHNMPECKGSPVKMKYLQPSMAPVEKTLTDKQPDNFQGNFSLSLTNCDVKSGGDQALFLNFRVSVFRSGIPDLCTVDLQNDKGLSLQIEKKRLDTFCEMVMDTLVQEKIVVPAGAKANLSFLDCLKDDLVVTATKTIECQSLSVCPVAGTVLTIPSIDSCLPPSLSQVIWVMNVPEQGTVQLSSPEGNLHQSVPGEQECDSLLSPLVSSANGVNIGRFCSANRGAIQRVQISSNITVTATAAGSQDLRQQKAPVLKVSFSSEITENLIYTVSPHISSPALLMTPNWPGAMEPDYTVSWVVNVPEEYSAEIHFSNVSRPQCHMNHAEVKIQELDSKVELGFREDSQLVLNHNILRSFYLNMSNCEPEEGKFAILSRILLQKKPTNLVNIILGVVGALAVLIIISAVVCVVTRKKKRQKNYRSSIFIPKGAVSLPGDASFPITRADESHVYTYIDDTMVYGDLLDQDGTGLGQFNGHQVDSYCTFNSPMGETVQDTGYEQNVERGSEKDAYHPFLAPSETFIPSRPRTPLDSLAYEDRRMVDNVLYTFKTPGDQNPKHLDPEPRHFPQPEDDSFSDPEQSESEYAEAM